MGVDERDVARRRRNAAIALAALGAPLAAASPAVADDAESTPPSAQAEANAGAETNAAASTAASTHSNGVAEGGSEEYDGSSADAQGWASEESDDSAVQEDSSAAETETSGSADSDSSTGAHDDEGDGSAESDAHRDEGNVSAGVHGSAGVAGGGEDGARVEDSKGGRGSWHGSASEKTGAHGGAAVTGVEVERNDRGDGRATAHVKAGAGLEAAIRADARAIAQEEARAQVRQEKVRAGIHARGRDAAALLEVFRAAWKTGGTARANALFEFCFGGERNQRVSHEVLALLASLEQRAALHERFRGHGYAFGHFKTRTEGSGQVKLEGEFHGGKPGEHHGEQAGWRVRRQAGWRAR